MLNAILYSKAGNHEEEEGTPVPWARLFREREDFVTATIFERLSYLPGSVSWEILCRTFHLPFPHYRLASLDRLEFWPSWDRTEYEGRVEPDVFLSYLVGEPARRIDLVVEAKHGSKHSAGQWVSQQKARLGAEAEEAAPDERIYAAIGGMGQHARDRLGTLRDQVAFEAPECASAFTMVAADWRDLASALAAMAPSLEGEHARVMDDAIEALSLFGYRAITLPDTLVRLDRLSDADRTLRLLQSDIGE